MHLFWRSGILKSFSSKIRYGSNLLFLLLFEVIEWGFQCPSEVEVVNEAMFRLKPTTVVFGQSCSWAIISCELDNSNNKRKNLETNQLYTDQCQCYQNRTGPKVRPDPSGNWTTVRVGSVKRPNLHSKSVWIGLDWPVLQKKTGFLKPPDFRIVFLDEFFLTDQSDFFQV